ncbi:MAG: hypothetical protein KAS32_23330 [Candidatus Peribacteraceae bacterium]|nr:hypothetical protein [Candidatus Peribacteraceae bacterium]
MRFDLFDAMRHMKKNFGSDGEILLSQDDNGVVTRLSVFSGGKFHHSEFVTPYHIIINDDGTEVMNTQFHMAIGALKHQCDV